MYAKYTTSTPESQAQVPSLTSYLNHTFLQKTGISVADLNILILQAVGIQEEIVDAHRQDAVIVVQRRRSM